jgi:2-C-methyl-D-erythritol 2,4-cyclodiphosphate synthase
MDFRVGNGYDVHQLAEGLPLVLGGVKIPHTKGCVAHSDGDVLIHALCDALLGALSLGDIGQHFPDTSDDYKGIDSKILLARVVEMIRDRGWSVVNVDVTLLAQKPKIAPFVPRMRQALADVMGLSVDRVSVKATTTERLGFVGREEGVAAYATCLLTTIDRI